MLSAGFELTYENRAEAVRREEIQFGFPTEEKSTFFSFAYFVMSLD